MLNEFEPEEIKDWASNPVTKAVIAQVKERLDYINSEGWKQETLELLFEAKGRSMEVSNLYAMLQNIGKE